MGAQGPTQAYDPGITAEDAKAALDKSTASLTKFNSGDFSETASKGKRASGREGAAYGNPLETKTTNRYGFSSSRVGRDSSTFDPTDPKAGTGRDGMDGLTEYQKDAIAFNRAVREDTATLAQAEAWEEQNYSTLNPGAGQTNTSSKIQKKKVVTGEEAQAGRSSLIRPTGVAV